MGVGREGVNVNMATCREIILKEEGGIKGKRNSLGCDASLLADLVIVDYTDKTAVDYTVCCDHIIFQA